MKKILLLIALVLPMLSIAQKKGKEPKVYDLVIGTYTGDAPDASKGIYVYRFYEETGKTAYLSEIAAQNPSYLAITHDQKFIYAINENNGKSKSALSAFKFDKTTGKLEFINSQPSIGSPAYVSVDKDQKNAFMANYIGGSLQVFPINKDGSLGVSTQTVQDQGTGPDKARQQGPYGHSAVLSPDDKYLMFADLGTDKINIFRYHASRLPPLTPAATPFVSTAGGAGPRHSVFSPNGKFMYNIEEMAASITAYGYHDGELKSLQTVKMMPESFKGANGAADIHISPDGLFLYATNRGAANEIVAYAINPETGLLTYIERYKTGENPRNFTIDPSGSFILVGNNKGIVIFRVNKTTGGLTQTYAIPIKSPVCLQMIPVE